MRSSKKVSVLLKVTANIKWSQILSTGPPDSRGCDFSSGCYLPALCSAGWISLRMEKLVVLVSCAVAVHRSPTPCRAYRKRTPTSQQPGTTLEAKIRCVLLAAWLLFDTIRKGVSHCSMHFYMYYLLIKTVLWGVCYFYPYIIGKKLKSRKAKKTHTKKLVSDTQVCVLKNIYF